MIRVLYKKVGKVPEVKIISNEWKLKKAIVKKKLEIIPYETLYIICHNQKLNKHLPINIVLDFKHIVGDFILVDISSNSRNFQGISQEDIIWYTQDLTNKTFNNKKVYTEPIKRTYQHYMEKEFENSFNKTLNFETKLINVLTNIELVLSSLVRNGDIKK